MVRDADIVTMKTNRKSHVTYRTAPGAMTLSDLTNSQTSGNVAYVLTMKCSHMNQKAL